MIKRICKLPFKHSFFLFGARQTGKTTLLNQYLAENFSPDQLLKINLSDREQFKRYAANDTRLGAELAEMNRRASLPKIVVIDEVQKLPQLLDDVQSAIDQYQIIFALTGSSARKLKRGGANLLGGRALQRKLFPFSFLEVQDGFNLDRALRLGTLPRPFLEPDDSISSDLLAAYSDIYLKEEIQEEALTRNIGGFINFLEVAAQSSGELINMARIARDVNIAHSTATSYFQILEDTLVATKLESYSKSARRRLSGHPKFYLFDTGVFNQLRRALRSEFDAITRGRLFEHFIVLETQRLAAYANTDVRLYFWRTVSGVEVDLLIEQGGHVKLAVEIKSSSNITAVALSGLRAFNDEYPQVERIIVAPIERAFELEGVSVVPWRDYLNRIHLMLMNSGPTLQL